MLDTRIRGSPSSSERISLTLRTATPSIHTALRESVRGATTLEEIRRGGLEVVKEYRALHGRVGFVAAPISLNGQLATPNGIHPTKEQNLKLLEAYTACLDSRHKFPVFSSTSIIDAKLEAAIIQYFPQDKIREMWGSFIAEVTHVFAMPGHKLSAGATFEVDTARTLRIHVQNLENDPVALSIASRIKRT